MTVLASPSTASLASTTIRTVWLNVAALLLTVVVFPAPPSGMAADFHWFLLLTMGLLALPAWRYVTWINRVQRHGATAADARRILAWLLFAQVLAVLGILAGIMMLFSAAFGITGTAGPASTSPTSSVLSALLQTVQAVVVTRLLSHVRDWIWRQTAAQQDGALQTTLGPVVRSAVPWLRATQVTVVLIELLWLMQRAGANLGVTLVGLVSTVLLVLMLEFSLRFARASAQDSPAASPLPPSAP